MDVIFMTGGWCVGWCDRCRILARARAARSASALRPSFEVRGWRWSLEHLRPLQPEHPTR
eukprot:1799995-Prymnesium_polylepis.1